MITQIGLELGKGSRLVRFTASLVTAVLMLSTTAIRAVEPEECLEPEGGERARFLEVKVRGQEADVWCWAAVTEMVIEYSMASATSSQLTAWAQDFREREISKRVPTLPLADLLIDCAKEGCSGKIEQCHVVSLEANKTRDSPIDCCQPPRWWTRAHFRGACVRGSYPDFKTWGLKFEKGTQEEPISFDCLKKEIAKDRPVAFAWRFGKNRLEGHIMLATGYVETASVNKPNRWVLVNDPEPPHNGDQLLIPYDVFAEGAPGRRYYLDYHGLELKTKP